MKPEIRRPGSESRPKPEARDSAPRLVGPPDPPAPKLELRPQPVGWCAPGAASPFCFFIWAEGGEPLNISTNAPASSSLPEREDGDTRTHARTIGALREAYHFTER